MGKIPAKNRRKVKDPLLQNEVRNAKTKLKINQEPANADDQEIPKKVLNLFKTRKQLAKRTKTNSEKVDGENFPRRPLKKIPNLERRDGESDRDLLWRAEMSTRHYLKKSKLEEKYGVDLEMDEKTGEFISKKRDYSFLPDDKTVKPEPQNKWEKKKMKKEEKKQKEREEKLKLKKEKFKLRMMKKKKKGAKGEDFERLLQDKVEFGDVAQQPPTLTAKPRKSTLIDKPGRRDLLLKGLIPDGERSGNLSGKRKDLSASDRQRLEEERQRAVDLYRQMQKQKHKQI